MEARVDAYFRETGLRREGEGALVLKTAMILGWMLAFYAVFVLAGEHLVGTLLAAGGVGLGMAGVGMAIQHDAGHHAYSRNRRLNHLASTTLDLCGASSFVWRTKHAFVHHTYPNVVGVDDDIELWPLARMAPGQPRYWWHRFQHLYMFPLYGFVGLKWFLYDDFAQLLRRRIGPHAIRRPKGQEAVTFWAGKAVYATWAVVLPVALHGWWMGLTFFVVSQLLMGLLVAVVFQLAHCVQEAEFVVPGEGDPIELDFARHQLATTVDFAPSSWLTWYLGGLNYQAVHHLFPRISHVRYPALSKIVAATCIEHGVEYRQADSVWSAMRSHYRWMQHMGRGEGTLRAHRCARPVISDVPQPQNLLIPGLARRSASTRPKPSP